MRFRKITLIRAPNPGTDVNEQLQWLGGSLGLFNQRDKEKSCFRIFVTLLRSAKRREELSSDEIATRTKLTRGTVVHHLNKLMGAGIVETYRSKYVLRVHNLEELIRKLDDDVEQTIGALKRIARDLDEQLGL